MAEAGEEIDPLGAIPMYIQIANVLQKRIERGELQANRPIPSETQMQQEFGVARLTARKAVAVLRERGLVVTVQGRGSYVKP